MSKNNIKTEIIKVVKKNKGLIKIKKGVKIEDAKFSDITENKKDIKFNREIRIIY